MFFGQFLRMTHSFDTLTKAVSSSTNRHMQHAPRKLNPPCERGLGHTQSPRPRGGVHTAAHGRARPRTAPHGDSLRHTRRRIFILNSIIPSNFDVHTRRVCNEWCRCATEEARRRASSLSTAVTRLTHVAHSPSRPASAGSHTQSPRPRGCARTAAHRRTRTHTAPHGRARPRTASDMRHRSLISTCSQQINRL